MENSTEKKDSLWKLQDRLYEVENDIVEMDEEEFGLLVGDIRDKIDSIKYVLDTIELEAEKFASYKVEMAAREKRLKSCAERLKKYVALSLEKHDTKFELGTIWKAQIRESKSVSILANDPTTNDLLKYAKYDFIKTKMEWSKTAIKKELEKGNSDVQNLAEIRTNKSVIFSTVNKVKDSKNG